ncbi:MAG: cytidine deaminase [Anaeromyxobacteraceae bacterium]
MAAAGPASPGARRRLVAAARAARANAHAPYSRFRVGAAVLAGRRVHAGCNVENASYGLTTCAERNAIAAAVLAGARHVDAVAVASGTDEPTPPCGACLQVLAEFGGPDLVVVLAGLRGEVVRTLGELMPHGFGKAFLGKGQRG